MPKKQTSVPITYVFVSDSSVPKKEEVFFRKFVRECINCEKGWNTFKTHSGNFIPIDPIELNSVNDKRHCRIDSYGQVIHDSIPHMTIMLTQSDKVENEYCTSLEKNKPNEIQTKTKVPLSCTRYGIDVAEVFINFDNWKQGFCAVLNRDPAIDVTTNSSAKCQVSNFGELKNKYPAFAGTSGNALMLLAYREYVINHEIGHALGRYKHFLPEQPYSSNQGKPAPIMMQQTKGLFGYDINTWPLDWE